MASKKETAVTRQAPRAELESMVRGEASMDVLTGSLDLTATAASPLNPWRQGIIKALNDCLAATELVCLLRYKRHHFKRSYVAYDDSLDPEAMIRVGQIAQRVVVQSYGQIIGLLGDRDPVTRPLLEDVLADQQVHADKPQERLID